MYDRIYAQELAPGHHKTFHWTVDVPQDNTGDTTKWLMSRKKGEPATPGKYHTMDSPTVRASKAKPRHLVEQAVLNMYASGLLTLTIDGFPRVVLERAGKVDRKPNKQKTKALQPLAPIAFEQKSDGTFHLELISDCDTPSRYGVVIPRATANDPETYTCQLYRRTNPRAKVDPQYALLAMSPGRYKPKEGYTEPELDAMFQKLRELQMLTHRDSKEALTLAMFDRQLERYDARRMGALAESEHTVQYRLKQSAQFVVSRLLILATEATPDNVAVWEKISAGIIANRERLVPKFEAYMAGLRASRVMQGANNRQLALHGAQTIANGFIPPMPTLAEVQARNAPRAAPAPANGTYDMAAMPPTGSPEREAFVQNWLDSLVPPEAPKPPSASAQTANDILGNLLNPT